MPRAGVRSGGWVFVLIISDLAMQLVREKLSPLLASGPAAGFLRFRDTVKVIVIRSGDPDIEELSGGESPVAGIFSDGFPCFGG